MNEITTREEYSQDKIELIQRTVAQGVTNDELQLFLYQCKRTGLDPLIRQIYCIPRKQKDENGNWVQKITIQVGIDGMRLIADRTNRYAPGSITHTYNQKGDLISATACVKKLVRDQWFEVQAEAFFAEYVQRYRGGEAMGLWARMPRLMLGKCAEALALRRAFPAELSGIYTHDEMGQTAAEDEANPTRQPEQKTRPTRNEQKAEAKTNNEQADPEKYIKRDIYIALSAMGMEREETAGYVNKLKNDLKMCYAEILELVTQFSSDGRKWNRDSEVFEPPERDKAEADAGGE